MPEGPEVQQVVNTLAPKVIQKEIVHIEVLHPKITMPIKRLGRQEIELFATRLQGAKIDTLVRKGKYLIFKCNQESSIIYILAHLGMTGAFFVVKSLDELSEKHRKHVHITFQMNDGSMLVYSDQRRFGWVGVLGEGEFANFQPIQKIGPDPFDNDAPERFLDNLRRRGKVNQPIKKLLLQPEIIAGVGNIYASECLYKAKIHPLTPVKDIADAKIYELLTVIKETFALAIKLGGSSIRDYVNAEGQQGGFQEHFKVYSKQDCPECGQAIQNIKIDNRSSFFCPVCQNNLTSIEHRIVK